MSDEQRKENAASAAPNWRDKAEKAKKNTMKSAEDLMKEMEEKQAKATAEAKKQAKSVSAQAQSAADNLTDTGDEAIKQAKAAAKKATDTSAETARNWTFIEDYTVQPDDNLSKISEKYYGNQGYWSQIYEANKATIGDNPNVIVSGTTLKIPKL